MKLTKTIASVALLSAAALVAPLAQAQSVSTTPAGFKEESLVQGFNLIGLTVHQPVLASGVVDAVAGTVVTDNEVDFGTSLTVGRTYVLEVLTGNAAGAIQEVTVFAGNTVTTLNDISADLAAGDRYELRAAATLETAFGTNSSVLKKGFSPSSADIVWIPDGLGGFNRFYLFGTVVSSWRNADTNSPAPNTPLVYTDGVFVQRIDPGSVDLVTFGEVKASNAIIAVTTGFNAISSVYPTGSTLQNCGLGDSLKTGFSPSSADIVWLPTAGGGFDRYYFFGPAKILRNADTNGTVGTPVELPTAFFIQRIDPATNVTLTPPAEYAGL